MKNMGVQWESVKSRTDPLRTTSSRFITNTRAISHYPNIKRDISIETQKIMNIPKNKIELNVKNNVGISS